ncbi:hypothetical protein KKA15_00335 [Patescibacteria group bacterium]|nr:hypothetical protein [Patescibacteria group bacterium]
MSIKNTPKTEVLMATDGQIGHIKGLSDKALRALTRKQANAIIRNGGVYALAYSEMLQRVLAELTNTFTVIANRVDYTRDPREVIGATKRAEHLNGDVVATMPRLREGIHENVEVEVVFFKLDKFVYTDELEREYEKRGLVPDPYAQAAVNEEDPSLADSKPNGTYWNRDGKVHSYLVFDRWGGVGRCVDCDRSDGDWSGDYWFAGVRKS